VEQISTFSKGIFPKYRKVNGKVKPGDSIAIVGAGPIGLATLLTAQFYSPSEIIMIDIDDYRLDISKTTRSNCHPQ
jgi:threonine dehydrogenase-like Zn-dependent dehydrogenase